MEQKNPSAHLGLRMDRTLHDKLYYIARYEGRSGNGQVLYLIRQCIQQFEAQHGPIPLEGEQGEPSTPGRRE